MRHGDQRITSAVRRQCEQDGQLGPARPIPGCELHATG